MLQIVLAVDCERFISFKQTNPRWNGFEKFKGKVNSLLKNLRYNKQGFEVVYGCLLKEKFPATLLITGNSFTPLNSPEYIEWGYHSLNHLPLTLIPDEKLEKETQNKFGVDSFNAPMWMIEDVSNPGRIFSLLKNQGFTHCIYRGKNDGKKHFHYNAVEKPAEKNGILCVHVSNFFEGNWSRKRIEIVKQDILKNLNNEGVYLLTTHDFTHRNEKNLLSIIKFVKELEKQGKLKLEILKNVK
jgi:hypothetical protein